MKETLCDKCKKEQPSHSCQDITALGRCYIEGMNTADKVEPKFKVGDWTVSNLDKKARQISEVHFDEYNSYYVVDGKSVNLEEYDRLHHLWTIQDAKDGDVLACNDNPFLFLKYEKDEYGLVCCSYCGISNSEYDEFAVNTNTKKYWCDIEFVNPATKEQRDLLFQKMHEAGYEWDEEKKEPKKIEQKPTDEEIKTLLRTEYEKGRADAIAEMQKPVDCIDCTNSKGCINCEDGNMKETLVQKPAWSEEDDLILETIIDHIIPDKPFIANGFTDKELVTWLKTLKQRYTWKPSDEQMEALHDLNLTGNISYAGQGQVLIELYNDLKKL